MMFDSLFSHALEYLGVDDNAVSCVWADEVLTITLSPDMTINCDALGAHLEATVPVMAPIIILRDGPRRLNIITQSAAVALLARTIAIGEDD